MDGALGDAGSNRNFLPATLCRPADGSRINHLNRAASPGGRDGYRGAPPSMNENEAQQENQAQASDAHSSEDAEAGRQNHLHRQQLAKARRVALAKSLAVLAILIVLILFVIQNSQTGAGQLSGRARQPAAHLGDSVLRHSRRSSRIPHRTARPEPPPS